MAGDGLVQEYEAALTRRSDIGLSSSAMIGCSIFSTFALEVTFEDDFFNCFDYAGNESI